MIFYVKFFRILLRALTRCGEYVARFFTVFFYDLSHCAFGTRSRFCFFMLLLVTRQEVAKKRAKGSPWIPGARANVASLFRLCRNGHSAHICAKMYNFSFCARILTQKCEQGGRTQAGKQEFLPSATHACYQKFQTKRDGKNPCQTFARTNTPDVATPRRLPREFQEGTSWFPFFRHFFVVSQRNGIKANRSARDEGAQYDRPASQSVKNSVSIIPLSPTRTAP